jgi:Spy/CpxP family protein refolding chaperone
MGKKVEIMGKTYKSKKLKKKTIEKLVAAQRADERKKQSKKHKKQLKKERKRADKDMATIVNRMSKALAPLETPTSSREQTPS